MGAETPLTLKHLLEWLDPDPSRAAYKYVEFHEKLTEHLARGAHTMAETLADEALTRVNSRLATPLLSEHYNSAEINDVTGLCRAIWHGGANDLPGVGRRIWTLLPESARQLVAAIESAGDFQRTQRGLLCQALNAVLRRRDFFRAEDVQASAKGVEGPLPEKIESELRRGLDCLSQAEVAMFNRRLLAASYPSMVKVHLSDVPEEDKLPHCKYFARLVLIEYLRTGMTPNAQRYEVGDPSDVERIRDVAARDPLESIIIEEGSAEERRLLDCLEECKRKKLSPRDRMVLDKYFTGIEIVSPDDEPLADSEITDVRRSLAEELGVKYETIRTVAHRSKKIVLDCARRCMRRQENSETVAVTSS